MSTTIASTAITQNPTGSETLNRPVSTTMTSATQARPTTAAT
jgi:hypothetical protein